MKSRKLITLIVLCILAVMFTGCTTNISEDVCTIIKQSPNATKSNIYMDGNICIIENNNYTNTYYIECNSLFDELNLIIKTNKTLEDMSVFDVRWCDIIEI